MILAMDLSLSGSAFAVLEIQGDRVRVVETVWVDNKKNSKKSHGFRLDKIARDLKTLLSEHALEHVVREKGFSRFHATTQTLFKVVGISDLMTFQKGFENIEELPPTNVKKIVTGDGKGSKKQVEAGIRKYLIKEQQEMIFKTDDVSDAVAVGIAYAIKHGILKGAG